MTSKSIVRVNPEAAVITMPIAVEVATVSTAGSASSPLSSPARKDSGLESGEASDASESHHATSTASSGSSDLYSKVPTYLTTVNVMNSDSASVNTEEDPKNYDRFVVDKIQTKNRFTQLGKLCQLSTFFRSAGQLSESGIYIPLKDEELFVLFLDD